MLLLARVLHVVVGIFWAGTIIFNAMLLGPAIQDTGPEGGKVMGALARRGMLTIMPIAGIIVILSGTWLYWHVSGGFSPGYMGSRPGMLYGLGMVAATLGLLLGFIILRPAMAKMATATPEEAPALRQRAAVAGRLIAILVVIAVLTMAVARYA